jgi:hypothetical protein
MANLQIRHEAKAQAANARGDSLTANRHASLAASTGAAARFYQARGDLDEQLDAARQERAASTAPMRLAAIQADAPLAAAIRS